MGTDASVDVGGVGVRVRPGGRRKVLVTGAGGRIGSYFAEQTRERYDLRLLDRAGEPLSRVAAFGEAVAGDIADVASLRRACEGVDTVLHLAADPSPSATWDDLLQLNIVGTYHTFVAAKAAGCRRVVYASSIHAISGYPADVQVKAHDPVNPGDLYGVSKCFGEALGRYVAEQEGLSCVVVRIGAFLPDEAASDPKSVGVMDAWTSRRDLTQLFIRSIEADNLRFAIFHGLSDNRFKRMDISNARELVGYRPVDDLTKLNPDLEPLHLSDRVTAHSLADGQKSGLREELKEVADLNA